MSETPDKRRPALRWAAFLIALAGLGFGTWKVLVHPNTPLPDEWNPIIPLNVADPVTPLTAWKLTRALAARDTCLAALETGAQAQVLPDFVAGDQCHIRPQVILRSVGQAEMDPINTRCQIALRMSMWERHGIQRAAQKHLGQNVRQITHFSSYNCREIRTTYRAWQHGPDEHPRHGRCNRRERVYTGGWCADFAVERLGRHSRACRVSARRAGRCL